MMATPVCACLSAAFLLAAGAIQPEPIPEPPEYSLCDIIVKFRPDVEDADRAAVLDKHGCVLEKTCEAGDFHRVVIPERRLVEEMAALLHAEQETEYAELNYYADIFFEPNDPYYAYQWDMDNAVTGGIQMQAAWDIQTGDPNVIIAVVDTGVAYEDYGSFAQAPDLAETSFVAGYDFVNNDTHPNDDQGHGTHVTGTIAQSTNNGIGVTGVAFGCSIMPVKVLDFSGEGDYFSIASGIMFAADHGAKVINLSLGGSGQSATLEQAVAYAFQAGVTVVCAAGNDYSSGDPPSYPAAYNDYCIAVGATRYDNTRASYSNTGDYLDIVAPGGDLLVDQNEDGYPDGIVQETFTLTPTRFGYYFFQGTSMATPHVTGVAGLLVSQGLTDPNDVRQALQGSAVDLGDAGWDAEYGHGLLDAFAALTYQAPTDADTP